MPATYINSLRGTGFPQFVKAFNWTDDPAEDQAFLDFVFEVLDPYISDDVHLVYRNVSVDRSGSPQFVWEFWDEQENWDPVTETTTYTWVQVGTGSKPLGAPGSYWVSTRSRYNLGIAPADMNIYWECDERGRALSIDSLVAP